MCYLPLKTFPGNSVPLVRTESRSTDSCKVYSEMFVCLFVSHQVAMHPPKSKGSTAVQEKGGVLRDSSPPQT